jgi:hypothetical protein
VTGLNPSFPWFDFVFGWLFLIAFVSFGFCVSTLRHHIKRGELGHDADTPETLHSVLPKREMLTEQGVRKYNLAIVCLLVAMGSAVLLWFRSS